MTETNNLSFEKKDKNVKKIEPKKKYYHKKQKTMSEISFHEIARIHNINEEMYNTINNNNRGGKYNNNKINVKKNEERNINIVKKSPHNKNTYKKTNFKK